MRFFNSVRYLRPEAWPNLLHSNAITVPPRVTLVECLEAFRDHDDFYSKRLTGVSRWDEIPPLQKNELSKVPIDNSDPIYESRSSGTTGYQAVIYNSIPERRFRQALAYRPFLFYQITKNLDCFVRQLIFIDGNNVDNLDKKQFPYEFGGRRYLTWRVGIAADPEKIYTLIKQIRPQVLRGLTSGIVRFVDEIDRPLDQFGIEVVSPSGEMLLDSWRNSLNLAFSSPVLDRYGSTETGSIAWQCPFCNLYHVNSDEIILEESTAGMLATPLFIQSQPLLRYQLDDLVKLLPENSDCHIKLPTISVLQARRDDWIVDGNGMKVSSLSFQFESISGLKAWQLHQLKTGELHLYFEVYKDSQGVRKQLAAEIEAVVINRKYKLFYGAWKLNRGGKFKRVVSDYV
jgi:phenylacetate-coenzyme A ligase PaaK-like adenylate-forming protein